jgi:hypothetical protein
MVTIVYRHHFLPPPVKIDHIANFGRGPYPHHRALDHGNNCETSGLSVQAFLFEKIARSKEYR